MSYEMYQEAILDHYRNPRNVGELQDPDYHATGENPLCGDQLALFIKLDDDQKVKDVRFQGKGCAISQASASMLTVNVKGKSLKELEAYDKDTILKMLGIPISPVRLKCAVLPLEVLKMALGTGQYGEG